MGSWQLISVAYDRADLRPNVAGGRYDRQGEQTAFHWDIRRCIAPASGALPLRAAKTLAILGFTADPILGPRSFSLPGCGVVGRWMEPRLGPFL